MNREIIHKRISSITGDIQRLSAVLFALDNTDIPSHFSDYERLSLKRFSGRSGSPCACGTWSISLSESQTICPKQWTP